MARLPRASSLTVLSTAPSVTAVAGAAAASAATAEVVGRGFEQIGTEALRAIEQERRERDKVEFAQFSSQLTQAYNQVLVEAERLPFDQREQFANERFAEIERDAVNLELPKSVIPAAMATLAEKKAAFSFAIAKSVLSDEARNQRLAAQNAQQEFIDRFASLPNEPAVLATAFSDFARSLEANDLLLPEDREALIREGQLKAAQARARAEIATSPDQALKDLQSGFLARVLPEGERQILVDAAEKELYKQEELEQQRRERLRAESFRRISVDAARALVTEGADAAESLIRDAAARGELTLGQATSAINSARQINAAISSAPPEAFSAAMQMALDGNVAGAQDHLRQHGGNADQLVRLMTVADRFDDLNTQAVKTVYESGIVGFPPTVDQLLATSEEVDRIIRERFQGRQPTLRERLAIAQEVVFRESAATIEPTRLTDKPWTDLTQEDAEELLDKVATGFFTGSMDRDEAIREASKLFQWQAMKRASLDFDGSRILAGIQEEVGSVRDLPRRVAPRSFVYDDVLDDRETDLISRKLAIDAELLTLENAVPQRITTAQDQQIAERLESLKRRRAELEKEIQAEANLKIGLLIGAPGEIAPSRSAGEP